MSRLTYEVLMEDQLRAIPSLGHTQYYHQMVTFERKKHVGKDIDDVVLQGATVESGYGRQRPLAIISMKARVL